MTPIKQTIMHDPKNGKYGNCLQACLASILDLTLDNVPHFADNDNKNWLIDMNEWLFQRNLYYFEINPTKCIFDNTFSIYQGYHFILGKSPRGKFLHQIIGKNGEKVFDPHPSNTMLTEITAIGLFLKIM